MNVLVDTNVLLRVAQIASPQRATARAELLVLAGSGTTLCIVPQVLYEYWVAATRPPTVNGLGMSSADVGRSIEQLSADFRLLRDERGIFERLQSLVIDHDVKGKTAHDARLVAAMMRHGVTHLLTFNGADFVRFPKITVLTPDEIAAGALPA